MAQTFIRKGVSFNYDNSDILNRFISVWYIDQNNKYILRKTTDGCIEFVKVVDGVTNTLKSTKQTFSQWQSFNIMIILDEKYGTKMHLLKNGNLLETLSNTNKSIIYGDAQMYFHDIDGTKQANYFIESSYNLSTSFWNDDKKCEDILNNVNNNFRCIQLLDNSLSTTQIVEVFPNNYYKLKTSKNATITGMYNDIVLSKVTTTKDIIIKTSEKTNKIKVDTIGDFSMLDFRIFNLYTPTIWDELGNLTWEQIKTINKDILQNLHGGVM